MSYRAEDFGPRLEASLDWLRQNYRHIWYSPDMSLEQKTGFLAAVCHPTRCFLMTLSLKDRLIYIRRGLEEYGN